MKSAFQRTAFEGALALAVIGCSSGEAALLPVPPPEPPGPEIPPVPENIAAGSYHACAVMSDGTVRCWGRNGNAQLGHACRAGHTSATCGVAGPVYADEELTQPLDRVVDVALGSSTSCAIRDDGTVLCWGNNAFGAFATGAFGSSATFPPIQSLLENVSQLSLGLSCCAILDDETLWCWSTWSDTTSHTPVRSPWVDRAADLPSWEPECVVRADATVACRGANDSGQVGDGTFGGPTSEAQPGFTSVVELDDALQVSRVGHHASCALRASGKVSCWGSGPDLGYGKEVDSPVPVDVLLPGPATAIASGNGASCAILADRSLWCWGHNGWGLLGDGTTEWVRLTPVQVVGLDDVVQVAMGWTFSCALRGDHTVWCWGRNHYGQLGLGYGDGPHPDDWAHDSSVPKRVVFEDDLDLEPP